MTCEQLYDLAGGLPDLMSEREGKAKVNTLLGLGTCQPHGLERSAMTLRGVVRPWRSGHVFFAAPSES
jgi:hypothetical protein